MFYMGARGAGLDFRGYKFDRPAVILPETLELCENVHFVNGGAFAEYLASLRSALMGVVLPLEIKTERRYAQELFGLELLEWARWRGHLLHTVPVLALSWLSFEKLQRRRATLLLAQDATRFLRLPADPKSLGVFVEEVRRGEFVRNGVPWEMAREGASNDAALTHHDLANDYYGAQRLWRGYTAALDQLRLSGRCSGSVAAEIRRTEETHFPWSEKLDAKLKQPHVFRFQAKAEKEEFPAYQSLNDQEQSASFRLLESHLINGLTSSTRVLLVDDQFEKGWGDVLLNIVFRRDKFTYRTKHEAVYVEPGEIGRNRVAIGRWARMVCVDSAERARFWLNYWDQMHLTQKSEREGFTEWATEWASTLGISTESEPVLEDILGHAASGSVDSPSARPKDVTTIVLLDLRLESLQLPRIFNVKNLSSIRLRTDLKTQQPSTPIIMFTASRHAITATQIMRNSGDADGWYVKEAPDMPPDDENSARGLFYLLDRLHLFSQLRVWYRDSLEWDADRKLEYAHFYNSPNRHEVLQLVDQDASRIFASVRNGTTAWDIGGFPTYLGFIQEQAPVRRFEIETVLVGRRVALGTLLLTATAEAGELRWNAEGFNRVLPGSPQSRKVKAVYDKLNFNRVLWLRTRDIHTQLLSEEIDWLRRMNWSDEMRTPIEKFLSRAYAEAEKGR